MSVTINTLAKGLEARAELRLSATSRGPGTRVQIARHTVGRCKLQTVTQ